MPISHFYLLAAGYILETRIPPSRTCTTFFYVTVWLSHERLRDYSTTVQYLVQRTRSQAERCAIKCTGRKERVVLRQGCVISCFSNHPAHSAIERIILCLYLTYRIFDAAELGGLGAAFDPARRRRHGGGRVARPAKRAAEKARASRRAERICVRGLKLQYSAVESSVRSGPLY